nr:hypothetical protein [Scytonema hofmannii]
MPRNTAHTRQHRRKGQSLIASHRINPEEWQISNAEAKDALNAQGCKVKEIKKIRCLKHQVCISYWDEKGGVCSGFFSYRIFRQWQAEVERLVNTCQTLKEWVLLNHIMKYEFAYYPYLTDMKNLLSNALKNRLYALEASVLLQAV